MGPTRAPAGTNPPGDNRDDGKSWHGNGSTKQSSTANACRNATYRLMASAASPDFSPRY